MNEILYTTPADMVASQMIETMWSTALESDDHEAWIFRWSSVMSQLDGAMTYIIQTHPDPARRKSLVKEMHSLWTVALELQSMGAEK